jgi:all-trans-retinol 13,14-reductase
MTVFDVLLPVVAATLTAGGAVVVLLFSVWYSGYKCRRSCKDFPPASAPKDLLKRPPLSKDIPDEADVIIIGAGPSGLALGALLSRRGQKVLVLEQHDRVGGGLHTFEEKGFQFDTGLHYVGEQRPGDELRCIVDAITDHAVQWEPLQNCPIEPGVYDRVEFLDSAPSNFTIPAGKTAWLDALVRACPDDKKALTTYAEHLKFRAETGLLFQIWRTLPAFIKPLLRKTMAAPQDKYSSQTALRALEDLKMSKKAQALLAYVSFGCLGVSPRDISYAAMCDLHNHFANGAFYPVGGPSAIATACVKKIERAGGRVFVRAPVASIEVQANTVVGVRLKKNDRVVRARTVVSTAGLRMTLSRLLTECDPAPVLSPLCEKQVQRTDGHIFLFVGVRGTTQELQLPRRNLWVFASQDTSEGMATFQADQEAPFGYLAIGSASAKDPAHDSDKSTVCVLVGDVPYAWYAHSVHCAHTPSPRAHPRTLATNTGGRSGRTPKSGTGGPSTTPRKTCSSSAFWSDQK